MAVFYSFYCQRQDYISLFLFIQQDFFSDRKPCPDFSGTLVIMSGILCCRFPIKYPDARYRKRTKNYGLLTNIIYDTALISLASPDEMRQPALLSNWHGIP